MRYSIHIFFFLTAVMLLTASCQFRKDDYVDFSAIEQAQNLDFRVMSQRETDLSDGLPADCYLPEQANAEAEKQVVPRQTTSTTGVNILQQMLKWGNQNRVTEIVGTYSSDDLSTGEQIRLSGKVMLPAGRRPKRLILVSHYTICSNAEAPSNCFSLEGILVKLGYGLIIPDYLGYGVTADKIHPYLVMNQTAINVLDMFLSVRTWLKAVDRAPEEDDIYLMGYSQGAANTMAVLYWVESFFNDPDDEFYIPVHRVFVGGGPYDIKSTYENYVNTDHTDYPVAVPLVLQGMILGNNLSVTLTDMMQGWLCSNLDQWINSKQYTSAQINDLIDTHVTHKMLTEEAMQQTSEKVAELYKAMTMNSIISYNWTPQSSVYMMHSIDDETVSYLNAINARSKWRNANITYNFGHYGGHVRTALRFIYTVQTLLQDEEKEMQKYE